MRTTFVLSLGIAAIATGAFAQNAAVRDWGGAPHPAGSIAYPREDDPAYRRFERQLQADLDRRKAELADTGVLSDVSAVTTLPPPAHWRGSVEAWRTHMARCHERYQTYDAESDTFIARPGVIQRCGL